MPKFYLIRGIYKILSLLIFILSFSIISCSKKQSPHRDTKIKVGMMFIPNVQFAPFYVALEKGFYKESELDVTFDFSSPTDAIQFVGIGKFDFVIGDGEQVIIARDKGLPVKYVMSIYAKYPLAIAALPSANIKQPSDLLDKTIGVPEFYGASYIGLKAFLKQMDLDESKMNIIPIGFSQAASLDQHRVDAAVVYLNNTPVQMKAANREIELFPFYEYISLVSAGIITNENMITQYPHLVKKFVAATRRGLLYVQQNPEEALQICFRYIKEVANNRDIQRDVLTESIKLYESDFTEKFGVGFSDPQMWENTQNALYQLRLIRQKQAVNFFYTNEFLELKARI